MTITKKRSRQKLREAVYSGKIHKPDTCEKCGSFMAASQIHGHHHKGYDRWFDVQWLCAKCHMLVDYEARKRCGDDNGMRKHPERSHFVTNNPLKKLSEREVLKIVDRYNDGVSKAELSREYNVSDMSIHYILIGKTWSHLTGIKNHENK